MMITIQSNIFLEPIRVDVTNFNDKTIENLKSVNEIVIKIKDLILKCWIIQLLFFDVYSLYCDSSFEFMSK